MFINFKITYAKEAVYIGDRKSFKATEKEDLLPYADEKK